jgi:hypothetical protein
MWFSISFLGEVNIETVPTFKMHHVRTVPMFVMHHIVTAVPTFKKLNIWTLKKSLKRERKR